MALQLNYYDHNAIRPAAVTYVQQLLLQIAKHY